METRLWEYFVAVADERSVTAASARLFAAQSTVSAGLKSLETDLGVRLLERTTKSVRLTPTGEALLPLVRDFLGDLDTVRQVAQESQVGLRGRVSIGTFPAFHMIDLPSLLGAFHRSHPLVDLRLVTSPAGSTGLAEDLARGRLDMTITAVPPPPSEESWPLGQHEFVALLPPQHPLAATGAPIGLADLADSDWIDLMPGYGNRVQIDAELARRGIHRRIAAEIGDLPSVPAYVAAGLGVAVIPDVVPAHGCVARRLRDDLPPWTLWLSAGRGALRRPQVRAVVDAIIAGAAPG